MEFFLSLPEKEEFERLIDFCSTNRLSIPIINMNDIENSIYISLSGLMEARKKAFKEMELFPAYQWAAVHNGAIFNRAISILHHDSDEKAQLIRVIKVIISQHNGRVKTKTSKATQKEKLKSHISNVALYFQRKEATISHVMSCLMAYLYPTANYLPSDFKKEINKTIKELEKARDSERKLTKYRNLFYLIDIPDDTLQEKINLYSAIRDNGIFPVQKVNDKHKVRMFIIALTQKYINDGKLSKEDSLYSFIDILKFNVQLLGLDCFPVNPMEEINIRKAINQELDRHTREKFIYLQYQSTNAKRTQKAPLALVVNQS